MEIIAGSRRQRESATEHQYLLTGLQCGDMLHAPVLQCPECKEWRDDLIAVFTKIGCITVKLVGLFPPTTLSGSTTHWCNLQFLCYLSNQFSLFTKHFGTEISLSFWTRLSSVVSVLPKAFILSTTLVTAFYTSIKMLCIVMAGSRHDPSWGWSSFIKFQHNWFAFVFCASISKTMDSTCLFHQPSPAVRPPSKVCESCSDTSFLRLYHLVHIVPPQLSQQNLHCMIVSCLVPFWSLIAFIL